MVFAGDTGQLLTAGLRPGTCPARRGVGAVVHRLVRQIGQRWPQGPSERRADSGVAVAALYDYLEAQHIPYTIGLVANARREALAASLAEEAKRPRAQPGATVRLLAAGPYQAASWPQERRVVDKAKALVKGLKPRFGVTPRGDPKAELYTWYTRRGDRPELCIKDRKEGCFAERLSCHAFWANQFRLLLHSAAYWRLDTIRRWLAQLRVSHLQLGTLRHRLLKIGG